MQQRDIHHYLYDFFTSNNCEIKESSPYLLDIQLTTEMDKLLMNRPFYWHYLEKTGGKPNPMRLTLITDQEQANSNQKGDVVHYGSPFLHRVFQAAGQLGSFIRLYEDIQPISENHIPLHPWLCINAKVSYQCDRKKDALYSLGLHLITGTILSDFQSVLEQIPFTPKIPDFCFTLSPIIKPKSGFVRLEDALHRLINQDDHTWADDARKRWDHDLHLLDEFYTDKTNETYIKEKQALQEQYEPNIHITIINGGMFYITKERIT
ncbi:YqhG family protein [Ectobacillus sp. sgz5001026]|uniref:YqhG family protein n=1 Tax=Ectobacillus sp. sgz5001026 TaxID=3242473 RepID=UPI0036D24B87